MLTRHTLDMIASTILHNDYSTGGTMFASPFLLPYLKLGLFLRLAANMHFKCFFTTKLADISSALTLCDLSPLRQIDVAPAVDFRAPASIRIHVDLYVLYEPKVLVEHRSVNESLDI